MSSSVLGKKDEWLTPDLFSKIAQNPTLAKAFKDPKSMAALSEMGKNPKEAMEKYGQDP